MESREKVNQAREKLLASAEAYKRRHPHARPADPNLRPAGSYAEDFPEEHEAARNRPPVRP